jgi:hypothetical protein
MGVNYGNFFLDLARMFFTLIAFYAICYFIFVPEELLRLIRFLIAFGKRE